MISFVLDPSRVGRTRQALADVDRVRDLEPHDYRRIRAVKRATNVVFDLAAHALEAPRVVVLALDVVVESTSVEADRGL